MWGEGLHENLPQLHVKTGRKYLSQKWVVIAPSLSFPLSAPAKSRNEKHIDAPYNEKHPKAWGLYDLFHFLPFFTVKSFKGLSMLQDIYLVHYFQQLCIIPEHLLFYLPFYRWCILSLPIVCCYLKCCWDEYPQSCPLMDLCKSFLAVYALRSETAGPSGKHMLHFIKCCQNTPKWLYQGLTPSSSAWGSMLLPIVGNTLCFPTFMFWPIE